MQHACGFYGGNQAKHAAELRAGMIKLQGHSTEVIPVSEYAGVDALEAVRGVPAQYVVMASSADMPVILEVC